MTAAHLLEKAEELGITIPTNATLDKYGFGQLPDCYTTDRVGDWLMMLENQGWGCGVCGKIPTPNKKTGKVRFVTDHEHVKGWVIAPPGVRRSFVRGITCWFCNHAYLGRGITVEKAAGVLNYLKRYQKRRP